MALDYRVRLKGEGNPNHKSAGWKTCVHCGVSFHRYNSDAKYCNHQCYLEANALVARRRAKRDLNHAELVETFKRLGWSVLDMADMGRGMPDVIIGDSQGTYLVEIKNPATYYGRKGLSRSQKSFAETWGGVVHVVKTIDEVVDLTKRLRETGRADGKPVPVVVVTDAKDAIEKMESMLGAAERAAANQAGARTSQES